MTFNCVWSEGSLDCDNRSHYAIATLLNQTLDKANLGFVHRNGFAQLPPDASGAVVVIHGEHQATELPVLLQHINRLAWSVIVVIGDDTALFSAEQLRGGRRKIWLQMPVPGRHDFVDRRLICSQPHDCAAHLDNYAKEIREKKLDWSFAGQVNHVNRRQCVTQLRMMHNGYLYESPCFWNGIPRDEYYKVMANSKVVMCPTGAATPDTMRVAEALEAGCVPIVEDKYPPFYPRNGRPGLTGYWSYVLGGDPPFPTLTDWRNLPEIYDKVLANWDVRVQYLKGWWQQYKDNMIKWLEEDVKAVC